MCDISIQLSSIFKLRGGRDTISETNSGHNSIQNTDSPSVNLCDSSFFFRDYIFWERKIPQCSGLPLARPQHPLQKTRECSSLIAVRDIDGNDNPREGTDRIGTRGGGVDDRNLEVISDLDGVARGRSDALQAGGYELAMV